MSYEMWWVGDHATNPGELIRVATGVGAATLEKLGVGTRGEFVGAPATPKDFEIV
jgi:hypothetical protein